MNAILESIVTAKLIELPCVFCSHVSGQLFSVFELKKHLDQCHLGLQLYGCHCCARGFSSQDALASHKCPSSFNQLMLISMTNDTNKAKFQQEYSLLICCKCGLQIDLTCLNNPMDQPQMKIMANQLLDALLVHLARDFILCTVYMLQKANNPNIKLSFLAEETEFSSYPTANESLIVYIQEALHKQENPNNKNEVIKNASAKNKKLDHNKFFVISPLPDSQYLCKLCDFRTEVNTPTSCLAKHMSENHLEALGNLRLFNAQSQFDRIDLGEGNCKYECKVCGHLTKMNIKPSALSQHFKDRHPEIRAQAAMAFATKRLGFPENSIEVSVANHNNSKIMDSTERNLILDKDIYDLYDQSEIFKENKWNKYEACLEVMWPTNNIFRSITSLGLLGDDVYSCQLCSWLAVGKSSAKNHYDCSHSSNTPDPFVCNQFDVNNGAQVLPIFTFTNLPYQGIPCFICPNSLHCSLLSLCSHLATEHNTHFSYNSNQNVDVFETASRVRQILCESETNYETNESGLVDFTSNCFKESNLQMLNVKKEDMLSFFQPGTVEPINQTYPDANIHEVLNSREFFSDGKNVHILHLLQERLPIWLVTCRFPWQRSSCSSKRSIP